MIRFHTLEGVAAPLPQVDVDTDKILPSRFLKTITRAGLANGLFAALREDPNFVLNRQPWDKAEILLALDNFGCGSSREHAPWALLDFGIRCIIAPSFADIFYSNCFKNGILPVRMPLDPVHALMRLAQDPATAIFKIDLAAQSVAAHGLSFMFDIDPGQKQKLLDGTDEVAASLARAAQIEAFEQARETNEPWWNPIPQIG